MNDVEDAAWGRLLDWGLVEVTGVPAAAAPRRRLRWWAAALLLLGLGVVIGVVVTQQRRGDEATARQPEDPPFVRVTSAAEIGALPADTRFVEGLNLGDEDVARLTRLRGLQGLRLVARSGTNDLPPLRLLTDAALPHVAAFTKLRMFAVDFQTALTGAGFEVLARLPVLEELHLRRFDLDDAALAFLPKLPALRTLDLSLNHGFRGEGLAAVARCGGLRSLSLWGCSQLSATMLAGIRPLRQLEELDLSAIGSAWNGFHDQGLPLQDYTRLAVRRAQAASHAGARDLSDDVLAVVAELSGLRVLHVAGEKRLTGGGIAVLGGLGSLRELDLGDCPGLAQRAAAGVSFAYHSFEGASVLAGFTDEDARTLRERLPDLARLRLAGCSAITDVAVAELLALRDLRDLDLSRCPKITSTSIELLAQARQIHSVRLDDLPWVTLAHVEILFARGITVHCARPTDPAFEAGLRALAERYRGLAPRR